jgi:hypothetical protein
MVTASQSPTSADVASAPDSAKRYARNSRLIALLGLATGGIGLLLTGISVAQQSPEIVEAIGDAYQIGRMRVNGGMVVQTILYNGRPIATGVMLPTRAEVASTTGTTTLTAAGALEIAGTVLSGEVSGKYFILHRTRGNRSTIHEIFFDGESIGQVAEDLAPALAGEPPGPGNERRDGKNPPTVGRGSAFSFESVADALVVHIVQPDGTTIRATSRNGGRLEQVIERRAVAAAVPVVAGNADPVVSRTSDRFIPGIEVAEPPKSALPKVHVPLPRQPPVRTAVHTSAAIPEPSRRPVTSLNPFATTAPAPRPQRTAVPAPPSPRAQISRTAPPRTTP